MELKDMTIDQLEARKLEIVKELDNEDADLDALEAEARGISDELKSRRDAETHKEEIRKAVAEGSIGEVVEKVENIVEDRDMPEIKEVRNSEEYIDAFAKYIKTGKADECRALLSENATNGTIAVPELVYDEIKTAWDEEGLMSLVRTSYLKGNLKVGFEISATGAVKHAEGATVDEEQLVLGIVELVPASIKKWISVSDEALDLQGEAFLRYIYREVAHKIAKAAADDLIAKIDACGTMSTSTCVGVPVITESSISIATITNALAELSDEASDPTIVMNKKSYAAFKAVQYQANYGIDIFEGVRVRFNNSLPAFEAASTGDTYAIVGDFGQGALANFPSGNDIKFKFDDTTLATSDLVRIIGREFVAIEPVAPNAFVKIQK